MEIPTGSRPTPLLGHTEKELRLEDDTRKIGYLSKGAFRSGRDSEILDTG